MSNDTEDKFEYQDNVNLFYCERCNQFMITEFDAKKPSECGCSCDNGKDNIKLLLTCDDYILRRNLQDALNQLNDLITFRTMMSAVQCNECGKKEGGDTDTITIGGCRNTFTGNDNVSVFVKPSSLIQYLELWWELEYGEMENPALSAFETKLNEYYASFPESDKREIDRIVKLIKRKR